jgi:hypothetical protein
MVPDSVREISMSENAATKVLRNRGKNLPNDSAMRLLAIAIANIQLRYWSLIGHFLTQCMHNP